VATSPIEVLHQGGHVLEDRLIDPLEHIPNPVATIIEPHCECVIDMAVSVLPSVHEAPAEVKAGCDRLQVSLTHLPFRGVSTG
jgi:hypothetical protein